MLTMLILKHYKSVILNVFTITDIDPAGLCGHVRQGISLILS